MASIGLSECRAYTTSINLVTELKLRALLCVTVLQLAN